MFEQLDVASATAVGIAARNGPATIAAVDFHGAGFAAGALLAGALSLAALLGVVGLALTVRHAGRGEG